MLLRSIMSTFEGIPGHIRGGFSVRENRFHYDLTTSNVNHRLARP